MHIYTATTMGMPLLLISSCYTNEHLLYFLADCMGFDSALVPWCEEEFLGVLSIFGNVLCLR